jgi:type III pantothenate kinase
VILTIDLGNTNTVFAIFKGKKIIKEWRFPTTQVRWPRIKAKINQVIVASVVPSLNRKLKAKIRKQYNCNPFFVTANNINGIEVCLRNKREIGADRVVDVLAAYKLYGGPAIVIDFGTATTFDVLSAKGQYLGGAIAPGIALARDALYEQAAKLPMIEIKAPKRIIGKNTISAMRSGLVFGYVAMVEGMVDRLKSEIQNPNPSTVLKIKSQIRNKLQIPNPKSQIKVIATGGLAKLICKYTEVVDKIDTRLTLKGLRIIGEKYND